MISINKVNTKKLEKALEKYKDDAIIEVQGVNLDTASTISATAKKNVNVDRGTLRNSIRVDEFDKINYNVGTNLPYAPYIEFGTGRKVLKNIPPEFKDLANQARKNKGGSFDKGLENIKRWCKRKGIDVKFAYIIFVNLLTNGMEAKPFFYPAFVQGRKSYNKDMKKAFERLAKRFNR
jgi:HK97 gp10 family phage protein